MKRKQPIKWIWIALALFSGLPYIAASAYTPPSSEPEDLHVLGAHVYFSADDGIHGRELWRCDIDGNAELVADITPGRKGSAISKLVAYRDILLFRVDPEESGSELWRTDGTHEGTYRLKQFNKDLNEGFDGLCGIWDDGVAFIRVVTGGTALWKTDGTEAGTMPLPMLTEGGATVAFLHFGVVNNGFFYFAGEHPVRGPILARCNQDGKVVIEVEQLNTHAKEILAMDGHRLIFRSSNRIDGEELFISGGTAEVTFLLSDISPGPRNGDPKGFTLLANPGEDPLVFFSANNDIHGYEPWVTNGVALPDVTRMVFDLNPGAVDSAPEGFVALGDRMFFTATHAESGKELWTIGRPYTSAALVSDVLPGPASSAPYALCASSDQGLFFSALDDQIGEELFLAASDGSRLKRAFDIYPGPESSFPYYTVVLEGRVVFAATDPLHGRELWCVGNDGKARLLADIRADGSINPSSAPHHLTPSSKGLFFVANDLEHGAELWISDGNKSGTQLVRDIFPGPTGSSPADLTVAGELLYFAAESGPSGARLWRSDGTEDGTIQVNEQPSNPHQLTLVGGRLFFCAELEGAGIELWVMETDGRVHAVKDIAAGAISSSPRDLIGYEGLLYFRADDGIHGEELWRSDGTESGTHMVRDIVSVPQETLSIQSMVAGRDGLYMSANLTATGTELWRFRTVEGKPMLVKDILPLRLGPSTTESKTGSLDLGPR